jgi:hypothetical protein
MFVTKHADTFTAFPDRRVEQGRNAQWLEIIFCQDARGRMRQDVAGNNGPVGG